MNLLSQDLRCLDAHAHLGNVAFERFPTEAQRHYTKSYRVTDGELEVLFERVLDLSVRVQRACLDKRRTHRHVTTGLPRL